MSQIGIPSEHEPLIDRELWDQVREILKESPRKRAARARAKTPALLKGLIFGPDGSAMTPTHTRKGGRLYRYYISQHILKLGKDACPVKRVTAAEIESIVIDQIRVLLRAPEMIVQVWRIARTSIADLYENDVRQSLVGFEGLWNELFPAEQARIVQLLVERVNIDPHGVDIKLSIAGLGSLLTEIQTPTSQQRSAA